VCASVEEACCTFDSTDSGAANLCP
jgi:hypothetical protein